MIAADVDLGRALVFDGPTADLRPAKIRTHDRTSVRGRCRPEADWHYVVLETERITVQSITRETAMLLNGAEGGGGRSGFRCGSSSTQLPRMARSRWLISHSCLFTHPLTV
jgi:hypothetical protein